MKVPFIDYCRKHGINHKEVASSYVKMLMRMNNFVQKWGLKGKVDINIPVLQETMVDYFIDTSRITAVHHITKLNAEKAYAYKAYWLLRRKIFQIVSSYPGCEFINEDFVTVTLLALIVKEKNITNDALNNNPTWKKFRGLLYRTLKFRVVTQQSLELMIEAFFCGCDFAAGYTVPPSSPPKESQLTNTDQTN